MNNAFMQFLDELESQSIYILREAFSQSINPVLLYSIGKDSTVLLHLAKKAFYPSKIPFSILHVDTRYKFKDMYTFRDEIEKEYQINILKYINPEAIEKNINPFDHGSQIHTHITKTLALKNALSKYKFDMVIGGARRDEEKSRSKEKIFSFRNENHAWDPKKQRPEFKYLYNLNKKENESFRVFPLSHWTELDIWKYIKRENLKVVSLYFAKVRPVLRRNNMLILRDDDRLKLGEGEKTEHLNVRFRTLGCYPLSGAIESNASSVDDIIKELERSNYSERQGRIIDFDHPHSMEKKKIEGYF